MIGDSPARTGADNPQWAPCACGELAYRCRCGLPPTSAGGRLLVAVQTPSGRRIGLTMVTGVVRPDPDEGPVMAWVAENRSPGHARWYVHGGEAAAFDGNGVGVGRVVSWKRVTDHG